MTFGSELDGPHWLGSPTAATFDVWTGGPQRCVGLLESHLGLATPHRPRAVRVAQLAAALMAQPNGFWRDSVQVDALGTAHVLLGVWDDLKTYGWRGDGCAPRLEQLATCAQAVAPGLAERALAVLAALRARPTAHRMRSITLIGGPPWPIWQDIAAACGVPITVRAAPVPGATLPSDLACVVRGDAHGCGDGSVQLYRPASAGVAAEHVAAFMKAAGSDNVVVIQPDSILDAALARHGLPTHGSRTAAADAFVQCVPLALQLARAPQDVATLCAWLTLQPNPHDEPLRRELLAALQRTPAAGSPAWQKALQAQPPAAWLDVLLNHPRLHVEATALPVTLLHDRCAHLQTYFASHRPAADVALALLDTLQSAVEASQQPALAIGQMMRLLALCMADLPNPQAYGHQAGAHHSAPAGMLAPAPYVVWWNCTADSVPRLPDDWLRPSELAALQQQGVHIPDREARAKAQALAWRRPLNAATRGLLCVAPTRNSVNDPCAVHPVWDEILSQLSPSATHAALVRRPQHAEGAGPLPCAPRSLPVQINAPICVSQQPLRRGEPASPSSIQTLLGCSFKWVVRYVARIDEDALPRPNIASVDLGMLAHELLAHVVVDPELSPDAVSERLQVLLSTIGPQRLAALYTPAGTPQRHTLLRHLQQTARRLLQLRDAHGFSIVGAEVPVEKPWGTVGLRGRIDVQLRNPDMVLDFKWGGRTRHRDALARHTAVQLATYSYMLAADAMHMPEVGYVMIQGAHVLTSGGSIGAVVRGSDVRHTWRAVQQAVEKAERLLAAGWVDASGNAEQVVRSDRLTEDGLQLQPPCQWCRLNPLCGHKPKL